MLVTYMPFGTGFEFHSSNKNCTQPLKLLNNFRVKIWGSHNGVAEDASPVGYDKVLLGEWFWHFKGSLCLL